MNNTVILTSCLDLYYKDEQKNRIPHHFGDKNGILTLLKNSIKKYDNFLFVASVQDNAEMTDMYANVTFESFDITLPFKNYQVLDGRTKDQAAQLISQADFIFLCGGHVPTQNKFFANINLTQLIQNTDAVICGASAGSMNCATTVYCPPELDGEALDPNFEEYFAGLGLTDINILPHFDTYDDLMLDGKRYIEDIILPDSYRTDILAINDGAYVVVKDGVSTAFGETYTIKNGITTQICKDEQSLVLQDKNAVQ